MTKGRWLGWAVSVACVILWAGCTAAQVAPVAEARGERAAEGKAQSAPAVVNPLKDPDFFPRAVWFIQAEHAPTVAELGCNLYVCGGFGQREPIEGMDFVWKHGLYNISRWSEDARVRRRVREHPSFVGWSNFNEPDNEWRVQPPEPLEALYRRVKAESPEVPVYLNFTHPMGNIFGQANSNAWYRRYCAAADILMYDYYPNNLARMGWRRQWLVAVGMDRLARFGGTEKPRWNWIECTNISNQEEGASFRVPTYEDIRAQVWISIIHGATGVGYFTHAWGGAGPRHARKWHKEVLIPEPQRAAVKRVNAELAQLAAVVNAGACDYPVAKAEAAEGRVDLAVRYHKGHLYLLAANMRQTPERCTFTLPGLDDGLAVEVVNEGRSLVLKGGKFEDAFAGFDVNLYRIAVAALPRVVPKPPEPWPDHAEEWFSLPPGSRWDIFGDVVRTKERRRTGTHSLVIAPYSRATWQVAPGDGEGSARIRVCTSPNPGGSVGPFVGVGNAAGDLLLVNPEGKGWQLTLTAENNFRTRHDLKTREADLEWHIWEFSVIKDRFRLVCDGSVVDVPEAFQKFGPGGIHTVHFIGDENGKDTLWVDAVDLQIRGGQ